MLYHDILRRGSSKRSFSGDSTIETFRQTYWASLNRVQFDAAPPPPTRGGFLAGIAEIAGEELGGQISSSPTRPKSASRKDREDRKGKSFLWVSPTSPVGTVVREHRAYRRSSHPISFFLCGLCLLGARVLLLPRPSTRVSREECQGRRGRDSRGVPLPAHGNVAQGAGRTGNGIHRSW